MDDGDDDGDDAGGVEGASDAVSEGDAGAASEDAGAWAPVGAEAAGAHAPSRVAVPMAAAARIQCGVPEVMKPQ
jgi:hypothetical protein